MDRPTCVDFHFDVMCPYAYQTSRWIRAVREQTDLTINWRFFSLEEINRVEGKKHPWEREWSYGWSMMRIGAALRRIDMAHLDTWYAAAGKALHEDGNRPHDPDVARQLLEQLGFDPGIVDAAIADPSTHDEVRTEHDKVVAASGYGVPTLFFADDDGSEQTIFGRFWWTRLSRTQRYVCGTRFAVGLSFRISTRSNVPRPKTTNGSIASTFRPYLEARDWVSINRGVEVGFSEDGFSVVGPANLDVGNRTWICTNGECAKSGTCLASCGYQSSSLRVVIHH